MAWTSARPVVGRGAFDRKRLRAEPAVVRTLWGCRHGRGRPPAPTPSGLHYGDRFMAAFWGCKIRYLPDQPPAAIALEDPLRHMETIQVPTQPVPRWSRRRCRDAARLKQAFGKVQSASTLALRSTTRSRSTARKSWRPAWGSRSWPPGCCARCRSHYGVYDKVSSLIDETPATRGPLSFRWATARCA